MMFQCVNGIHILVLADVDTGRADEDCREHAMEHVHVTVHVQGTNMHAVGHACCDFVGMALEVGGLAEISKSPAHLSEALPKRCAAVEAPCSRPVSSTNVTSESLSR